MLVFTAGDHITASSKYRAFLLGSYLTETRPDIEWKLVEPSTKILSSLGYLTQMCAVFSQARRLFWRPEHDVVFIQRAIYNKFVFALLILQNILRIRPSIFDFDDAIFRHSGFKTRLLCKTSSAVIVGSHFLQEYAQRYSKRVILVPTCIRFSDYASIPKMGDRSTFTIGWIGNGPASLPELRFMAEALKELNTRTQAFRLLLIGHQGHPEIPGLFEFLPAERKELIDYVNAKTDADLIPYLAKMDIGLMPLEESEWNRGKCAFKAIQYMATGAAVVASPVGENPVLITHRVTGMLAPLEASPLTGLAATKEEWASCIQELMQDPALRQRITVAARDHVRAHYSFESQIPKLTEVIDSLIH